MSEVFWAPEGTWILTVTGRRFEIENPRPQDVDPYDIAHSLAHLGRFCGHARELYSVAQHSLLVSELVPRGYALAGLLHDAAEAYIGDITTPVKRIMPGVRGIEARILRAIEARFGLPSMGTQSAEVARADRVALAMERNAFLPRCDAWPIDDVAVPPLAPVPIPPSEARERFLARLEPLYRGHVPEEMAW